MTQKHIFDVEDAINAECTTEPIGCRHCQSHNVTFHQYIGDAYCSECGEWQRSE